MFTSLTNVLFIYCFSLPLLCKNKTNKRETHILQPTETTHCQFFPSSLAENCYKTSDFLWKSFFPIPIWTQWCNLVIKLYILIICLMFFFNIYEPFHCHLQRSWGSSGDQILLQNSCVQIWSQKLFLKKNWWNVLVHHTNTSKRSFHTSIKCSMYLISISIFFFI